MKLLSRFAQDASCQLTIVGLLAVLAYGVWGKDTTTHQGYPSGHRNSCHTCASIPTGESSKFEQYLLAHGIIDRAHED